MNQKEYDEGYKAAIEAIKQALNGQSGGDGGGQDMDSLDPNMTPPPVGAGNGGSKKKQNQQNSNDGSRTSPSDENHGVVREEDCSSIGNVGKYPSTPGAMMDSSTVNDIVKKEGHDLESESQSTIEKTWERASLKAAKDMDKGEPGSAAGNFKSALEGLWKTSTDWKSHLRKIVGRCINKNETRQAFAAKKRLAVLGEIRRTSKDKYDCLDYMVVCVDSSGSMSDDQLKMCLSEVYEVARAKKPLKLVVMQCDTKIQWIKEYKDLRELKKDIVHATVYGRGGTNFKPLWDMLNNDTKYNKIHPEVVLLFTDGHCPQYKRSLKNMENLVWCILDNPSWDLQYPDRGTYKVFINTKDIK